MPEFRPEYVEALNAARWNAWWIAVLAIPVVLLSFSALKRRFGCVTFSVAFVLSWLAFFFAVQYYWDAKLEIAKTPEEIADATADSGRAFGPFLVGIPLVFVYVSIVAVVIYGLVATLRWLMGNSTTRKS